MDARTYCQHQIAAMRMVIDATTADLTDDVINVDPPGIANGIGASYLHLVSGEDLIVHTVVQGQPMLWETEGWAKRFGLDAPPGGPEGWASAHGARLAVESIRAYEVAVRASSDAFVAGLTEADFDRPIDLFGQQQTVADGIALAVAHGLGHAGDISALKGMQGLKGLPF